MIYLEMHYVDASVMYIKFESEAQAIPAIEAFLGLPQVDYVYYEGPCDTRKLELIETVLYTSFMLNLLNLKAHFK